MIATTNLRRSLKKLTSLSYLSKSINNNKSYYNISLVVLLFCLPVSNNLYFFTTTFIFILIQEK